MDLDSAADCTVHSECSPSTVEIDPRGDLTLLVGRTSCRSSPTTQGKLIAMLPKPVAFRVCSRTVARAARAFDVMLYGKFAEARHPDSGWTVRLPDDNPEAMAQLLPVMHGRFDDFDASLLSGLKGLSALYNITVIADKYDLAHILRPWADKLVKGLSFPLDPASLWISWVLGSSVTFKSCTKQLVWDMTSLGPYIEHEPSGAYDRIRELRRQLIDDLMRPVTSTVTALTAGTLPDKDGLQCRNGGTATSVCNLVTLASLIQSLHSLGLWPLPDSVTWVHSASQLRATLSKLKILRNPDHQHCQSSKRCPDSVTSFGVLSWVPSISVVPTNEQLDHLKRQAAKTGLAADS